VENIFGKVCLEDVKGENGRIFARCSADWLLTLAVFLCCSVPRDLKKKGKVHTITGYEGREGE